MARPKARAVVCKGRGAVRNGVGCGARAERRLAALGGSPQCLDVAKGANAQVHACNHAQTYHSPAAVGEDGVVHERDVLGHVAGGAVTRQREATAKERFVVPIGNRRLHGANSPRTPKMVFHSISSRGSGHAPSIERFRQGTGSKSCPGGGPSPRTQRRQRPQATHPAQTHSLRALGGRKCGRRARANEHEQRGSEKLGSDCLQAEAGHGQGCHGSQSVLITSLEPCRFNR